MVFAIVLYAGLIIASFLGILWGVGSLLVGFDRYREASAIKNTPEASLDSIAVGPSAVRGWIEPVDSTIDAMYDCEECVAYELEIEDVGSSDRETLVDREYAVPFDVVTDEGSIRVRDASFDIHPGDDREWKLDRESYEAADAELREFERRWNVDELRSGDVRTYRASYLCPGDEVYAYGNAEIDDARPEEAKPLVLTDREDPFFVTTHDRSTFLRKRRFALAKEVGVGVPVAMVSLAAFLWLTGVAQLFLGA